MPMPSADMISPMGVRTAPATPAAPRAGPYRTITIPNTTGASRSPSIPLTHAMGHQLGRRPRGEVALPGHHRGGADHAPDGQEDAGHGRRQASGPISRRAGRPLSTPRDVPRPHDTRDSRRGARRGLRVRAGPNPGGMIGPWRSTSGP